LTLFEAFSWGVLVGVAASVVVVWLADRFWELVDYGGGIK